MPKKMANNGSFKKGDKRAGRPKGVGNKTTTAAKEAFALAFDEMGGVPRLVLWAKLNPTEFYKLFARLIPVDVTSAGDKLPTLVINVPPLPDGQPDA